jgi:drug/metabolite transporter (DMT)-like permease
MASTVASNGHQQQRPAAAGVSYVYLRLSVLVVIWAANWTLIKSAYRFISPSSFVFWRFCGAAVVMAAMTLASRQQLMPVAGERVRMAIIGILQIGLCLAVSSFGLAYVGPGRAAVLIYTMQLWALPLGWLLAHERVSRLSLLGGIVVTAGLVIFLNPALVNWHDSKVLIGNGLVLFSSISWAFGACLYRRYKWQTPFWTQTFWQVLWSGIAVGVTVPLMGPRRPVAWNAVVVGVLIYNWLGATVLCYLWWGKILSVMRASRAGQFLALTPITAVLISTALTHEPISLSIGLSIVLISVGICLAVRGK